MDALSLLANVISVISAATKTARRLERLRSFEGAPDQLLQVINEVSDIRIIFTSIQQAGTSLEVNDDQDDSLRTKLRDLLVEAQKNFEFFDGIAQRVLPTIEPADTSNVSWRLWMRKRKDVQKHAATLRDIKRKIMDVLTTLQVSDNPTVHVQMASIISNQNETQRVANSIQRNMEDLEVVTTQALSVRPQLNALQEQLQTLQSNLTSSELRRHSTIGSSQNTGSIIRIPTSVPRSQICGKFCMCRCHKRKFIASPSWMQHVIGTLFIGYTGSILVDSCNENMCMRSDIQPLLTVNYYFPSWLLSRVILLTSRWHPSDGCMISVRTPRIVSSVSLQIINSQYGNVSEMRRLFSEGMASPFDVDELGSSLLMHAVVYQQADMCKFLLLEYSDPYHVDKISRSCLSLIWREEIEKKVLSQPMMIIKDLFKGFFENHDVAKEQNPNIIHQIVLGIVDIDLYTQLSLTTSGINTPCAMNRTPLVWAACQSNLEAIQVLIDFGASFKTTFHNGWNVFHHAALTGSLETLHLLLDVYMARPMPVDIEGEQLEIPLFDRPAMYGATPLSLTIERKRTNHALLLLEYQCNINPPPPSSIPFIHAAQFNSHEILKSILTMDVKMDTVDGEQMGILHVLGATGDFETISIFLSYEKPITISPISVDIYGNTPIRNFEILRQGYIQEDPEQPAKSREAFEALLNKVNEYQLQLQ